MRVRPFKPLLFIVMGLGLMALFYLALKTYWQFAKPMFVSGNPIIVEVKSHSSANALVEMLHEKKLISSKTLFLNLIKFEGLAPKLKAGLYQIMPRESAQDFIHRVVAGDVYQIAFQIIEGTTAKQVAANLMKAPYLQYQDADWLLIKNNHSSTEGLLLADTYRYLAGSTAQNLLKTANLHLENYLAEAWQNRDKNLPYISAYEMLIAASILEKETAISGERRLISGVIINRLKKHMPLQMDPSVVYGLGEQYQGKLSHANLSIDSPYNTYRHKGLPPTPIAMVGKLAIDSAAHPLHSDYLYFVAKGDGSHVFSKTYEEQRHAISKYLLQRSQKKD